MSHVQSATATTIAAFAQVNQEIATIRSQIPAAPWSLSDFSENRMVKRRMSAKILRERGAFLAEARKALDDAIFAMAKAKRDAATERRARTSSSTPGRTTSPPTSSGTAQRCSPMRIA